MNIYIEGDIAENILDESMPIYIACRLDKCSVCEGSGWSEYGHATQGKPGDRFYMPAQEGVKCRRCKGTGYILELDTAIPVEVNTVVSHVKNSVCDS